MSNWTLLQKGLILLHMQEDFQNEHDLTLYFEIVPLNYFLIYHTNLYLSK